VHIKTGILRAVIWAAVSLATHVGATEVQSTSYASWLAEVGGAPVESNGSVANLGPVNVTGLASVDSVDLSPITISLSDGETFALNPTVNGLGFLGLSNSPSSSSITANSQSNVTGFLSAASPDTTGSTSAKPSAEFAYAVMIGGGLFLFGARRKVFSNISASRA
jgi:hypothetical protein